MCIAKRSIDLMISSREGRQKQQIGKTILARVLGEKGIHNSLPQSSLVTPFVNPQAAT